MKLMGYFIEIKVDYESHLKCIFKINAFLLILFENSFVSR